MINVPHRPQRKPESILVKVICITMVLIAWGFAGVTWLMPIRGWLQ